MKSIIVFMFFIAFFFILTGVYDQKLEAAQQNKEIEYRFIPRTLYEEQTSNAGEVSDKFGSMFDNESPWFDRTVGPILNIERPYATVSNAPVTSK